MGLVFDILAWLVLVGFVGFGVSRIAMRWMKYAAAVRSGVNPVKAMEGEASGSAIPGASAAELAEIRREVKVLSDRLDEKDQAIRRLEQQVGFLDRLLEDGSRNAPRIEEGIPGGDA